ncbi:hypothetical protein IFM89_010396 [Coptis chinensis]|uniref:Uncharacterized protein n=1 Tax=Coptis chinensis TaxID=261450 RepID=A0A835M9L1_9MAGN|nr:hypothetical protein IFM89_010396 [Coptis chinensis]
MADLYDTGLHKRKLATIAAVSAATTAITAVAYVLLDIAEEPHCKKSRSLNAVKDKIERMNTMIDQISKSIDPLHFTNTLYTELMKEEGFSPEYLDCAFQILVKDYFEAQIFLARKLKFRRKIKHSPKPDLKSDPKPETWFRATIGEGISNF